MKFKRIGIDAELVENRKKIFNYLDFNRANRAFSIVSLKAPNNVRYDFTFGQDLSGEIMSAFYDLLVNDCGDCYFSDLFLEISEDPEPKSAAFVFRFNTDQAAFLGRAIVGNGFSFYDDQEMQNALFEELWEIKNEFLLVIPIQDEPNSYLDNPNLASIYIERGY